MPKRVIFINGKFAEAGEKELQSLTPWNVGGRGVFETMAVYDGRVFAWPPHWIRMQRGLTLMGMTLPYSGRMIEKRMREVLRLNELKAARIRVMATIQDRRPCFNIVAQPSTRPAEAVYSQGYALQVSSFMRQPGRYTHIKSIDYQMLYQAHETAKHQGFDEALLMNQSKECVEAAYANLFIVKKETVMTPPVKSGCLNGITRNVIEIFCREEGIPLSIRAIPLAEAFKAEEMFITNSLLEVMPVTSLDGRKIGNGQPGATTLFLAGMYRHLVKAFKRKGA